MAIAGFFERQSCCSLINEKFPLFFSITNGIFIFLGVWIHAGLFLPAFPFTLSICTLFFLQICYVGDEDVKVHDKEVLMT